MEARSAQSPEADRRAHQRDEALARCLKWNTHGGSHFIETIQKTKQLAIADGAVKAAGSATP
jgi:hypothetical protein